MLFRSIAESLLKIELQQPYLTICKIDSAFVVWEINGAKQKLQLEKHTDTLLADVSQLKQGNGKLTVMLYTNIKLQYSYKLQWVHEKQISLSRETDLSLHGPESKKDASWLPRVVFTALQGKYFAIFGLRPDDPYFYIQNVPPDLNYVSAAKVFYNAAGGVKEVGGATWNCNTSCTDSEGSIVNSEYFKALKDQIGTKGWNVVYVTLTYSKDEQGDGLSFDVTTTIN